ncbi:MAG TPA: MFS transporter [Actinomycetes bacterium]|nr:MFS transporter [Actinomycetes bacterium]
MTTPAPASKSDEGLAFGTPVARWVLAATVLGSGMAFIDATVVNVALPSIGESLNAGLSGLAWTINAYTLSLASLILLGGSLGDRLGRRRVFIVGVIWFAVASLLCGIAPNIEFLIAARVLQGIGGALLTPGSLAILQSSFRASDRARAIGAWSGLAGVAGAAGPFLGGWLVQVASWRWVFLINLPFAVAVVLVAVRHVPESRDPNASKSIDVAGAALCALGLGAVTYGLITAQNDGIGAPEVVVALVLSVVALIGFVVRERVAKDPMLPLAIFSSPLFRATNLVTFAVYAAIGGVFFWLVLNLQVVAGYSPLAAGLSLFPVTALMLVLSSRMGALSQRIGPRVPMTAGPLICAVGTAGMTRIGPGASYFVDVFPSVALFGFGLSVTVAPLTATVLAAAPERHSGLASGVNNAVARVAGLLAVAVLPLIAGLSGEAYTNPALMAPAYETAMWACAVLLAAGGILAVALVRRPTPEAALARPPREAEHWSCGIDGPPLEGCPHDGALTPSLGLPSQRAESG